jgi:hypothetical protein
MGWKHDGYYQTNGAGADRGTYCHGRGVHRHLRRWVAAAALVMASGRVKLLATSPGAFQWAGFLVAFPTGPPASTQTKRHLRQ